MNHVWSVLCQNSTIDSETNQISLINCLEQLGVTLPSEAKTDSKTVSIQMQFEVVTLWSKPDKGKGMQLQQRIEFVDPAGEVLTSNDEEYTIADSNERFRTRTKISRLVLSTDGRYIMRVYVREAKNFTIVAELPLDVVITYRMNLTK